MAIRSLFALTLILLACGVVGCGEKTTPADPSVSKIGTEDTDPKTASRTNKKGTALPQEGQGSAVNPGAAPAGGKD